MNRFKIVPEREIELENIWKKHDTHLKNVLGFEKFNFIKGKKQNYLHLRFSKYMEIRRRFY
tara:strand:+ start:185 stop:367 length:183 start_codon:yes stop_codon:yes gene_type:complete